MQKGKVKFYNKAKGFGFIIDDSNGKEVFVHSTGLIDDIKENDKVSFDTVEGKKGMNAIVVELL